MRKGSVSYFDKVAQQYTSWYEAPSPGGYALRARQQRVLELLDQPGGKVLDVGCGPGVLAPAVLDSGRRFWGVDASPNMIEECRDRFGNDGRAHFAVSDAKSLPFWDEFFDAVISLGVIDRMPAYTLAIEEMVRVVRKGGTLLIAFPNLLSPYASWKNFILYPAVGLLHPIYYPLLGRPCPPCQFSSLATLHTVRSATSLLAAYGAQVSDVGYYYFNFFLSPLDEIFPLWIHKIVMRLEPLRFTSLKWLGAGFILKAKKPSGRTDQSAPKGAYPFP